jgi:hypothetical protein
MLILNPLRSETSPATAFAESSWLPGPMVDAVALFDEATAMLKVLEPAVWNDPSVPPVCGGTRMALPIDRYEWHTDDCRLAPLLMRIDQL